MNIPGSRIAFFLAIGLLVTLLVTHYLADTQWPAILWTVEGAVGLAIGFHNLRESWRDQHSTTHLEGSTRVFANAGVRREIIRQVGQFCIVIAGIASFFKFPFLQEIVLASLLYVPYLIVVNQSADSTLRRRMTLADEELYKTQSKKKGS